MTAIRNQVKQVATVILKIFENLNVSIYSVLYTITYSVPSFTLAEFSPLFNSLLARDQNNCQFVEV